VSRCEGLPMFQELTVPIFWVCWWFGSTKTDDWGSNSALCISPFGQSQKGMRPLWLVGGVKRLLHLAQAVYTWLWTVFW